MIGGFRKMVHLRHHEIEHTNGSVKAVARSAGWTCFSISILGLTPQALCWHPLRGLVSQLYNCHWERVRGEGLSSNIFLIRLLCWVDTAENQKSFRPSFAPSPLAPLPKGEGKNPI